MLRTQTMNLNICHMVVPINYQTTWSQLLIPTIPSKTSMLLTSTYPMWYNVIPPFVHLDPSLYPTYQTRAKGLDYLIFRNYISYVSRNVYRVPKQLVIPPTYIPYSIGNQFPTMIQPMTSRDIQLVTTSLLTTI
jgi:hypothetical protein